MDATPTSDKETRPGKPATGRYWRTQRRPSTRLPAVIPPPALPAPHAAPRKQQLEVRRPQDGQTMGQVPVLDHVHVLEAVERARYAQRAWIQLEPHERFEQIRAFMEGIGRRSEEIASLIREETGKPEIEALGEILATVELLKHYADHAPRLLRREIVRTGWMVGKSAYTYREPFGVIGAITPWSYPFMLIADTVAAALFTGNAVVVKPSEHTPFSALKIRDLCLEAGLPEGLVDVVTGDASTGAALVDAGVDKLVFVGTPATGRKVMAAAAQSLTPVTLELGGKDAALVLADADLERAARGIIYGAFHNAGQSRLSTERVLVVASVYDAFVERVTELTKELRAGTTGEYDVGPMITGAQLRVVEDHVADAVARGARITVGGERQTPDSAVFLPTVLADVTQSMRVVWEETCGPILPVMKVKDEEEAVRLANVSPYGLFASVWTSKREHGERVAERLRVGGVSINDTLSHYSVPGLPVGGFGESGHGRRRGAAGLEEMTRPRTVLVHRTGLTRELWWFPYSERGTRLMRALLGYRQTSGFRHVLNTIRDFVTKVFRPSGRVI